MSASPLLDALAAGRTLSESEASSLFDWFLSGTADSADIAGALSMIQARSPTEDEIVGAARSLRAHAGAVPAGPGAPLTDTCGTGGTRKLFNVSTAAAIVAAAAAPGRIRIAKHGNRSRTGRGSAEVLSALGVNLDAPPAAQARALAEASVCFCFAVNHHAAVRHAAAARRTLNFPTLFNIVGPLCNPAGADRQVVGVFSPALLAPVAGALRRLGAVHAIVTHSDDGLDELTTTANNRAIVVRSGTFTERTIDARDMGLPRATIEALEVPDLASAAEAVQSVLAGTPGPRRDITILNAAAALVVADVMPDFIGAVPLAAAAIDSGAARRTLDALIAISHAR